MTKGIYTMQKYLMAALLVLACLVGIGTTFSVVNKHAAENAPETDTGPSLKLEASNFKFDQAEYKVKAGESVKVSLNIKEGIHAVAIEGTPVKLDKQNNKQDVVFDKPGKYTIMCTLPCGPGHADMKSTLIVE